MFDFWVCLQLEAVRVFAKFYFNVGISILKNKKTTVWNKFPGGMQCARSGFYHGLGFLFQNWLVGTTIRQLLDPPKYVKPGSPKFWNCGTQIAMTVVAIFLWLAIFFWSLRFLIPRLPKKLSWKLDFSIKSCIGVELFLQSILTKIWGQNLLKMGGPRF